MSLSLGSWPLGPLPFEWFTNFTRGLLPNFRDGLGQASLGPWKPSTANELGPEPSTHDHP